MISSKTDKRINTYKQALEELQNYIEKEEFKGYDPYDTLKSKIKFKSFGRLVPILAIQFQKRNPVNIRAILGIKKDHNPKGLGLLLYSYCSLQKLYPNKDYKKQIDFLFNHLKSNYSKGFSGYCWGYNFDWASSNKYINAYSPNIVVTAFVAKGIFKYYELTKSEEALTILKSISQFILKDLPKTETPKGVCFSYTTLGVDCCYNASLLAASVLGQLYSITKEDHLKEWAQKAIDYVVDKQHADGHWNYSIDESGKERVQIDFHQGYVIDCILDVINYCDIKNDTYLKVIEKGIAYYKKEQFFETGQSKWRLPKIYPTEIHNQTQGIITFLKTSYLNPDYSSFAKTIADWTLEHMLDKKGFFYYQKLKSHTIKIPYMRWTQAWVFVALVELINVLEKKKMAKDFTLDTYRSLLQAALDAGYTLTSYEDYIANGTSYSKVMILRHDVDARPENSFDTAVIENQLGAKGSYYFRVVKQSFDTNIIQKIKDLGHEIGYHYENMDHCNGDIEKSYADFKKHLERFNQLYPIKTICMHGSPLSKWDNKDLWKKYNYKDLGIIAEPYFDLDFSKILYITDTGRSWNKTESSVRDKVKTPYHFKFNSTHDIITAFKNNELPNQVMLNIHPQRWTNNTVLWIKEYLIQNLKNTIKKQLIKNRS